MYSFAAIAVFATAVLAQSSTDPAVIACQNARSNCQVAPNANMALCASNYAACLPPCDNAAYICSTNGTPAAQCNAAYNACTAASSSSAAAAAATGSPQAIDPATSSNPAAVTACQNARYNCQVAPNANMALCASNYAACLPPCENALFICGTNGTPAAQCNAAYNACKAAPTTSSAYTNGTVYTTTVLSYTTYCPYATTIVQGAKTITVTAPGYVTITDCPCTITTNVPAGPVATVPVVTVPATVVVVPTATPVAPTTTKAVYTGAANVVAPAGLLAVAIGAMAAF